MRMKNKILNIIKITAISSLFTGNRGTIRKEYCPVAYREAVKDLFTIIEGWIIKWQHLFAEKPYRAVKQGDEIHIMQGVKLIESAPIERESEILEKYNLNL